MVKIKDLLCCYLEALVAFRVISKIELMDAYETKLMMTMMPRVCGRRGGEDDR